MLGELRVEFGKLSASEKQKRKGRQNGITGAKRQGELPGRQALEVLVLREWKAWV